MMKWYVTLHGSTNGTVNDKHETNPKEKFRVFWLVQLLGIHNNLICVGSCIASANGRTFDWHLLVIIMTRWVVNVIILRYPGLIILGYLRLVSIATPKAPRQVHTWHLWVTLIPRIKSNPPFFTLSVNPHTFILLCRILRYNLPRDQLWSYL